MARESAHEKPDTVPGDARRRREQAHGSSTPSPPATLGCKPPVSAQPAWSRTIVAPVADAFGGLFVEIRLEH